MKLEKLAGATSEIWQIFVRDSSSTTGAGLAGLVFNSASLTAYYHRDTDTTATAITLVTMTVGTFTSSGFKEIDATNMPGWYQFCPPNASIASGAKSCAFHLKGATNMAPLPIEVQLVAVNPDSATAFMTSVATVTTVTNQLTAAQIATGVWQDTTAGDFTTALSVGKSVMNGVSLGTGLTVAAVSGAVGSVTGAVGSVTGAVGSVTGLTASDVGAIKAKTDNLPAAPASTTNITAGIITTTTNLTNLPTIPANWLTAAGTAADFGAEIADAILDRDMSTGTDSGSTTVRTPRQALRAIRNKTTFAAGSLTVTKEDDATTSWTAAVSTDAAALPIVGIDPAGP